MTEIDPKWIRVSSILQMIPTLDAYGRWGYPMQNLDQDMLQRKAELGTSVHEAIAAHRKGDFIALTDREQGYLDSYLKWEGAIKLISSQSELRLYYEPMNLTGCIDMLAKLQDNGIFHLVDFKCTVSADHTKWRLQAALYHLLAIANGMVLDKRCYFIQLDPLGEVPKIHEYEITKEIMDTAISFYNAYIYLTKC